jgi:hypothetical protein
MPLSTYSELRASILGWLARPDDPLVGPAVADFIRLFEAEAARRLKTAGAEKRVLATVTDTAVVPLPADFAQMRMAAIGGFALRYLPPDRLQGEGGTTNWYSIIGNEMILGPGPNGATTVAMTYQSGVPPLSDSNPSNWLLVSAPDLYLYGSLVAAEAYIGHDERIQLWVQARESGFESLRQADNKARWPGGLQIRLETATSGGAGNIGSGATVMAPPTPPGAIVSGTAPSNPAEGALWWDQNDGQLYIWYVDQWVAASNEPEL